MRANESRWSFLMVNTPTSIALRCRRVLVLGALFLAALLLRLYGLGHQNLWHDECWTLQVAAVPLNELPDFLLLHEGSKPPLYFAFMHYWLQAAGGEFW